MEDAARRSMRLPLFDNLNGISASLEFEILYRISYGLTVIVDRLDSHPHMGAAENYPRPGTGSLSHGPQQRECARPDTSGPLPFTRREGTGRTPGVHGRSGPKARWATIRGDRDAGRSR